MKESVLVWIYAACKLFSIQISLEINASIVVLKTSTQTHNHTIQKHDFNLNIIGGKMLIAVAKLNITKLI